MYSHQDRRGAAASATDHLFGTRLEPSSALVDKTPDGSSLDTTEELAFLPTPFDLERPAGTFPVSAVRTTGVWYIADIRKPRAIEQISQLLDSPVLETSNTSMRIPTALRDAAALAVKELGVAPSATALTAAALRTTLEAVVMQAALDDHYERHPEARPSLGDLALAAAELDGNPLANEPEHLRRAADEIVEKHPDASADDVLLWAEARAIPAA